MEEVTTVFIFASSDGVTLGLTPKQDGGNLPSVASAKWDYRTSVPMTAVALAPYVRMPEVAITNLIMRGYHLARLSADVVPFPTPHRSVS